jgi:hypothetical protein
METDGIKAFNVFVDSSVFIGKNYNYDNYSFVALMEAVVNKRVNLLITDVTIEEIKAHIYTDVEKSLSEIKKIRTKVKVLRNVPPIDESAVFKNIDQESVCIQLVNQFEQFLKDAKAVIVPISEADAEFVFDCYFKKYPPFGEGKKKSEFPDAFVLSALGEWAESMQEDVIVVSQDLDMIGIEGDLPRLSAVSSLEEFLGKVTSYFEELAQTSQNLLKENLNEIKSRIEREFQSLGFILVDQNGDVNETRVTKVGDISSFLIALKNGYDEGQSEAKFELTTTIEFEADVSYDNMDTASYDSEDKVLIPWETVAQTVQCSEIVQVDLSFLFDNTDSHNVEIEELNLHTPKDVMVHTEDDGWPYK